MVERCRKPRTTAFWCMNLSPECKAEMMITRTSESLGSICVGDKANNNVENTKMTNSCITDWEKIWSQKTWRSKVFDGPTSRYKQKTLDQKNSGLEVVGWCGPIWRDALGHPSRDVLFLVLVFSFQPVLFFLFTKNWLEVYFFCQMLGSWFLSIISFRYST